MICLLYRIVMAGQQQQKRKENSSIFLPPVCVTRNDTDFVVLFHRVPIVCVCSVRIQSQSRWWTT